jgi:hypothetical protein
MFFLGVYWNVYSLKSDMDKDSMSSDVDTNDELCL